MRTVAIDAEVPGVARRPAFAAGAALHLPHHLRRHGLESAVRLSKATSFHGKAVARARTAIVRARLRRAEPLDALVSIGTGFGLPPVRALATFEDMTIKQALRAGYTAFTELPPSELKWRLELQRRTYQSAAVCCGTCPWAVESIVEDYGVPADKVRVIGVGPNHHTESVERDWSTPRFLFAGKDWQRKNGPGVLPAFGRLREEMPTALLDVVGEHPEINQDGVTGYGPLSLAIPDQRQRMAGLFQTATCFVMPSHHEPSALAYVDAATAGIPSIASAAGGSGWLVGDAGRVVDPSDDEALFQAMRELADPSTAAELGALALERARDLTWESVGRRMVEALRL